MAEPPRAFCWYELMTTDVNAAQAFYASVLGWALRDSGTPGMDYRLASTGGSDVAGMMVLPDDAAKAGARPGWVGYVAVEDVDAKAEKLKSLNGVIHKAPADIPGVGRFAMVADPQGAVFVLFTPRMGEGAGPPPLGTVGDAGWRELYTGDLEAAFAFYAELFGWTKGEAHDMGPMGPYQIFHAGAERTGGMMKSPSSHPGTWWNYYFYVDGAASAAERVTTAGGTVVMGPQQVPDGHWIVQCMDPQGAVFGLLSRAA